MFARVTMEVSVILTLYVQLWEGSEMTCNKKSTTLNHVQVKKLIVAIISKKSHKYLVAWYL